jgi:hypothetical protein
MWVPWVAWFMIDTYALRHYDMKFGRDGGFVFGVFVRGATALVSTVVAGLVHGAELAFTGAFPWRTRRAVAVVGACVLAALSPLVPHLFIPGLGGAWNFVVPWAIVSIVVITTLVVFARWRYGRELGTLPPNNELQRTRPAQAMEPRR